MVVVEEAMKVEKGAGKAVAKVVVTAVAGAVEARLKVDVAWAVAMAVLVVGRSEMSERRRRLLLAKIKSDH